MRNQNHINESWTEPTVTTDEKQPDSLTNDEKPEAVLANQRMRAYEKAKNKYLMIYYEYIDFYVSTGTATERACFIHSEPVTF